jgi:CheY-like chemotaxis protein
VSEAGMKVLVVDDSRMARRALIRLLKREGADEILEAQNGSEAVALARPGAFDLIVMDLTMPVMSGFEACRLICEADPSARVAIVSADVQPQAVARCRAAGAMAFLGKPIKGSQLTRLIEDVRGQSEC